MSIHSYRAASSRDVSLHCSRSIFSAAGFISLSERTVEAFNQALSELSIIAPVALSYSSEGNVAALSSGRRFRFVAAAADGGGIMRASIPRAFVEYIIHRGCGAPVEGCGDISGRGLSSLEWRILRDFGERLTTYLKAIDMLDDIADGCIEQVPEEDRDHSADSFMEERHLQIRVEKAAACPPILIGFSESYLLKHWSAIFSGTADADRYGEISSNLGEARFTLPIIVRVPEFSLLRLVHREEDPIRILPMENVRVCIDYNGHIIARGRLCDNGEAIEIRI